MRAMPSRKTNKGFTLVEILLVIAILMAVGVMEMRRDVAKANEVAAAAVGKQMALIGDAVDRYMAKRGGLLQAGTDPNCASAGAYCELDMGALIADGLLPATFENVVKFGGSYKARVRRVVPPLPDQEAAVCSRAQPTPIGCPFPYPGGGVPTWQLGLQGLVFTSASWRDGSTVNWTMLGEAAKHAGPLAGVSQGTAPIGLFAGWNAAGAFGTDFSDGQLVYITGTQSALWSQFVRRDGTLPMTGNLDMGAYNVMNMRDLFLNGPPTNPRNKNLSSLMPQWVFKGVYSVDEAADPPQNFVPEPVCGNGGLPRIKVLMQLMKGTRAAYYNETPGGPAMGVDAASNPSLTTEQLAQQASDLLAGAAAGHALYSWAEQISGGWLVHFRHNYNQTDKTGDTAPVIRGSGLAELYCHYPNQ